MIAVEQALADLVALATPLEPILLPLDQCDGCILAEDCRAERTQPPFDVSAMDGYALAKRPETGERFELVGEIPAGYGKIAEGPGPGKAYRIFTGAPVPQQAKFVVIQEDVERTDGVICVNGDPGENPNIRPAGGNFARGQTLLNAGTRLNPQSVALAAAGNHPKLRVIPKPQVALMMNGDELAWPSETAPANATIASNGFGLQALVNRLAGKAAYPLLLDDDQDALEEAIAQCNADIIVTIGGASVGDYDLFRPALTAQGFDLKVLKVALRPGKPTFFGKRGRQIVLGLPGNPVSSFVSGLLFLEPLIKKMARRPVDDLVNLIPATLGTDIPENGPRTHLMRAIRDDHGTITPVKSQDSSLSSLLVNANCLLYRPAHAPAANVGDACSIIALPQ